MSAAHPDQFYLRPHPTRNRKVNYLPVKSPREGDVRVVNTDGHNVRELVERLRVITVSGSIDEEAIQKTIALLGVSENEQ